MTTPPSLVPNPSSRALKGQIDEAVSREVDRRLSHLGQHPVLTPNVTYQYGPPQTLIMRPSLQIPQTSSWQQAVGQNTICPNMAASSRHFSLPHPPNLIQEAEEDDYDESPQLATYKPATVNDCLFHAYNFDRDFHLRSEPPFPREAVAKSPDVQARRMIAKRYNSRVKRERASETDQRAAKWKSIVKRANKAATEGRVRNFSLL